MKRDNDLLTALIEKGYIETVGSSWMWTDKGFQVPRLVRRVLESKVDHSVAPKGIDQSMLEQAGFNSITCMPL